MSQDPMTEKRTKANRDVKKLCEFFVARKDWTLPIGAEQLVGELVAATNKFDEHLRVLIRACGAEPTSPCEPLVESQGVGTHDSVRMERFTAFLRDLDTWLTAQPGPSTDPDTIAALQEMEGFAGCIIGVVEGFASDPEDSEVANPPPLDTSAAQAVEPDVTPGDMPDDTDATEQEGAPQQLALDDTDAHPMVQEFQGLTELSTDCTDLVDGYLAAWRIEYSYYNRKKLLERILRWISSAPDGHVLVIKMKTAEEPYEPYPSYISRDVLAGKPPPTDPQS